MQTESERFRAWTQHIYQHFFEELAEEGVSDKFQVETVLKPDLLVMRAKAPAAADEPQDEEHLRHRPPPTTSAKPS